MVAEPVDVWLGAFIIFMEENNHCPQIWNLKSYLWNLKSKKQLLNGINPQVVEAITWYVKNPFNAVKVFLNEPIRAIVEKEVAIRKERGHFGG